MAKPATGLVKLVSSAKTGCYYITKKSKGSMQGTTWLATRDAMLFGAA